MYSGATFESNVWIDTNGNVYRTAVHQLQCQKQDSQTEHKHAQLPAPKEMEWPKAVVFCGFLFFFFLRRVLAHKAPARLSELRGPPSSPVSLSGWFDVGVAGTKRPPPPALAAGPSPSGEPLGSWRCGAADPHGGPGAAGSPCWGWGPWKKDKQKELSRTVV